jgi:hypothetical protein
MGSPTSDDEPTGRVEGPGAEGGRDGGPADAPSGGSGAAAVPGGAPGHPPGGPGGSHPLQGAYGYGGLPPDDRSSNRGLVIALVAGLVILVGLVVALIIAYTRDGGETVSAAPSTGIAQASAGRTGPAATRADDLLAAVPAVCPDRAPGERAGDGDTLPARWGTHGDHRP